MSCKTQVVHDRLTGRLGRTMGYAIGDAARSVSEVAGVDRTGTDTSARDRRDPPRQAPLGPLRGHGHVGADRSPWDTGFVDISGSQGLLGQRSGRTSATVAAWLTERSEQLRDGIEYVAIDPAAVYAAAVRTPDLLPNATLVVDHFHVVAKANDAVTRVRQRVTWDQRSRRGRAIDPDWANRRRLLRARERMSDKGFRIMWNEIDAQDPSAQILSAYIAKEELRTLLSTVRDGGDRHRTSHRLQRFFTWCADSQIQELITLAKMVDTWWPEINAFITTGITNARTEGDNLWSGR